MFNVGDVVWDAEFDDLGVVVHVGNEEIYPIKVKNLLCQIYDYTEDGRYLVSSDIRYLHCMNYPVFRYLIKGEMDE